MIISASRILALAAVHTVCLMAAELAPPGFMERLASERERYQQRIANAVDQNIVRESFATFIAQKGENQTGWMFRLIDPEAISKNVFVMPSAAQGADIGIMDAETDCGPINAIISSATSSRAMASISWSCPFPPRP